MVYKLIDLFAGTGAFSYVFSKYDNIKCVFANDMYNASEKIYNNNHLDVKLTNKDLNNIDINNIPNHDILCGGFPCQPFSIAGKREGFDDDRSNVFWKILKILKKHKPNIVILENVKNLLSHDKGNTFKIILTNLKKNGYHVKYKILNTSVITNIPQNRERIYIICFKSKILFDKFNFDFPIKNNKLIKNFLENDINDKYYYTNKLKVYDKIKKSVIKHIDKNVLYQYRRVYIRENKNNVCPTLTANMGSGGHNVPLLLDNRGIRKLTPRECFNLQGFPRNYDLSGISDCKLYKLSGNAVSIPIIELIGEKIINII